MVPAKSNISKNILNIAELPGLEPKYSNLYFKLLYAGL